MNITERQWQTAKSWSRIFYAVESRRNARKMRLFGCACCRRIWDLLIEPRSRAAVERAEAFADGVIGKAELTAARKGANEVVRRYRPEVWTEAHEWAASTAEMVTHATYQDAFSTAAARAAHAISLTHLRNRTTEERSQVELLRDIFGNPFRPVAFDPAWRTDTAVALARTMYESREFGAMPILADALQDAGCEDEQVLSHCRDANQTHVRGCWVCDLVLGRR